MKTIMLAATLVDGFYSSMQFLVFLALGACGLIALGVSAIFGGHADAHDTDGDGHPDQATDSDGEHGSAPSFFSPRIFFAFLIGFGGAGAIASAYGWAAGASTGIGFIPGLVMAIFAWAMAYYLYKQQANSALQSHQIMGAEGTIVTAIRPGELGEANLRVNGQILPITAMSEDGASLIPAGTRIRVVSNLGDKVVVTRQTAQTSV